MAITEQEADILPEQAKRVEVGDLVKRLIEQIAVEVEAKKKSADEQAEIVGGEKVKVEA